MLLSLISRCSYHVIQGEVTTLAGSTDKGDVNGNGNGARFNDPVGLWFDEKHQSLLVCDYWNSKLKRVSLKGILNTAIHSFQLVTSIIPLLPYYLIIFYISAKFK